jgi:hypothetical protein
MLLTPLSIMNGVYPHIMTISFGAGRRPQPTSETFIHHGLCKSIRFNSEELFRVLSHWRAGETGPIGWDKNLFDTWITNQDPSILQLDWVIYRPLLSGLTRAMRSAAGRRHTSPCI